MNGNKRRSVILIIITVSLFLVSVVGATFAYFSTTQSVNTSIPANVATAGSAYSFSAASNGTIEFYLDAASMSESNVSTEKIKTSNATISVSLASPNDETATTCTYDIVWVWDEGSSVYDSPDFSLPHTDEDGKEYNFELSTKVDDYAENDLSKLESSGSRVILQKGLTIKAFNSSIVNKEHNLQASVYNLPIHQEKLYGKTFKSHVTVDNVNCVMSNSNEMILADFVRDVVYETYQSGVNPNNSFGVYLHDSSLENGAHDNSYRYAGADSNVNNFVCFDGTDCSNIKNLYRIISVNSSGGVKLYKYRPSGYYDVKAWNSYADETQYLAGSSNNDIAMNLTSSQKYGNIWAIKKADGLYHTSTLNDYLNNDYLNSLGKDANLIDSSIWMIGGVLSNDLDTKNVYQFMLDELDARKGTYESKVGLMYASDFGFAALPEYWTKTLSNYGSTSEANWLALGNYPWTITRVSDTTNRALYLLPTVGNITHSNSTNSSTGLEIFPAFVLKPDVKLINAHTENVGTINMPMIIS